MEKIKDMIYRQDAIDATRDEFKRTPTNAIRAMDTLKGLPSAQPERKKGHWKLDFAHNKMTCSECGRTFDGGFDMDSADNFCRHCGSDNRG